MNFPYGYSSIKISIGIFFYTHYTLSYSMADTFKDLFDFIDRASKNRKYLPNTATSFRTPLRIVEVELTDEEKASVGLLKERLDQIFHTIFSKNSNLSAASLEVYKRRIRNLISDYEKYGKDSSKMANWNREVIFKKISKAKNTGKQLYIEDDNEQNSEGLVEVISDMGNDMIKFELPFDDGTTALIFTPRNLTKSKLHRIKGYITYLETSVVGYPENEKAG